MQVKGSDYLDYDVAVGKGMELIKEGIDPNFGLLVVCGANMGLRISDLLTIDYDCLKSGMFIIKEKKTGNKRKVVVNSVVEDAVMAMPDTPRKDLGGMAFTSNKGSVYSSQHVNRLLKKHFKHLKGKNISSHSLRKCWGRRYYDKYYLKEGLSDLQMQFGHSSPAITLRYIGITQEKLDSMYERVV